MSVPAQPSTDLLLSQEERFYISERLMSRARFQTKKLRNAEGKTLHPILLEQIRQDLQECIRLALKLQRLTE